MATPAEVLAVALPALAALALVGIAVLVARNGGGHLHTRLFAALYLLSGVKSLGDALTTFIADKGEFVADLANARSPLFPDSGAWLLVTQLCGLAMLPLLFLFCATFPQPTRWMQRRPALGVLAFVPSAVVGAMLLAAPASQAFALAALAFNVLSVGMTAAALLLLLRTRASSPDHIERTQAGYVALGFLPSFVATWAITALILGVVAGAVPPAQASAQVGFVLHYLSPLFEFLAAGLVGFAILKYNILGVSTRFRVGVKSVLAGFIFVLVFLVTQVIENKVLQGKVFGFADEATDGYGSFILSGVTGLVLFKPIEKVSSRVSNRLLPHSGGGAAGLDRAAEVYHAQCTYVLRDAQVSEREMAFLRNLRAQLGLSEAQARDIEEKVERLLKVDAPQTGAIRV